MLRERVYLITERRAVPGGDLVAGIAAALVGAPAGSVLVQLREKELSTRALVELAHRVVRVCHEQGARLLISDRVDVALAVGADGVHLPGGGLDVAAARALLPAGALVGVSTHAPAEASAAGRAGADLVTLSPIWDSPGKGAPLGAAALAQGAAGASLFALGGLDGAARAAIAVDAGAHGVAVIRAVFGAPDPGAATAALARAVRSARADTTRTARA